MNPDKISITLSSDVFITSAGKLDGGIVGSLVAGHPVGAQDGVSSLRLGRAAAYDSVSAFIGSGVVEDRRTRVPLEAEVEPRFPTDKYDFNAWAVRDGGFIFWSRGCWFRAVPNMVRNMASAFRQAVTVVVADGDRLAEFIAWNDAIGFADWREYAAVITMSDWHKRVDPDGIVVLLAPVGADDLDLLSQSPARYRFVIDVPDLLNLSWASSYACGIGPILHNNLSRVHLLVRPVATAFNTPVMKSTASGRTLDERATLASMLADRSRNRTIADCITHMRGESNIFLTERIAIYHAISHVLDPMRTKVLVPHELSSPQERAAVIARCGCAPAGALNLLITYDDAIALADQLPVFERAFLLTPAGAVRQSKALAPVRSVDRPDVLERVVVDVVDPSVPDLARKTTARHRLFSSRLKASVGGVDRRYV